MRSIQAGDNAPEVAFTVRDGRQVSLSDFRGQVVVFFFYPADNTFFCTREACSFRDAFPDFQQAGAVVIGVSGDSESSHEQFAASKRLPYLLVSDANGSLRRAFGVRKRYGVLPSRVTYVIDRAGVVRDVFQSQFLAKRHVDNALRIVRNIDLQSHVNP
jgi:thioredoxin-dependent peroxiredoxin